MTEFADFRGFWNRPTVEFAETVLRMGGYFLMDASRIFAMEKMYSRSIMIKQNASVPVFPKGSASSTATPILLSILLSFFIVTAYAQDRIECTVRGYDILERTHEVLWHFDHCSSGVIAHLHPLFPSSYRNFIWPIKQSLPRLDGHQWLVIDDQFLLGQVQDQRALWRPTLDVTLAADTIEQLQNATKNMQRPWEWGSAIAPQQVLEHVGEYLLIYGKVHSAQRRNGRWFINFGDDYRSDFSLGLQGLAEDHFRAQHGSPRSLIAQQVFVLGQIESFNGPFITLSNGWQLIR